MCNEDGFIDDNNTSGLIDKIGVYYWFSIDSKNQRLIAGVGEARMETAIYTYQFTPCKSVKSFLESLQSVELMPNSTVKPLRLLRDPVTWTVPLYVKTMEELTMDDIAEGYYMPKANLSAVSQQLYESIGGPNFQLDTPEFPDFAKAIQHSIVTPGLWCYERLLAKATEFTKEPNPAETYLRITLGENNGDSPGIPYVMEIWPAGNYSPVHNHGGADAVIRILHGSIQVSLFPYLSADGVDPFAMAGFGFDDVTWISPTLNQVHQLRNVGTEACVTIQCYMYESNDTRHYDYFDYIDGDGSKKQYEPDSDMDFVAFKSLMKAEWDAVEASAAAADAARMAIITSILSSPESRLPRRWWWCLPRWWGDTRHE